MAQAWDLEQTQSIFESGMVHKLKDPPQPVI